MLGNLGARESRTLLGRAADQGTAQSLHGHPEKKGATGGCNSYFVRGSRDLQKESGAKQILPLDLL